MKKIALKILDSRLGSVWALPAYGTKGSAGVDLIACIDEPLTLKEGQVVLIPTGISVNIYDPSIVGILLPRSGLGHKKGLILGNGSGVIDSDYQGQLFVSAWNRNPVPKVHFVEASKVNPLCEVNSMQVGENLYDDKAITINPGEKIVQMLFLPVIQVQFELVTEFNESERGDGGFGHTGAF